MVVVVVGGGVGGGCGFLCVDFGVAIFLLLLPMQLSWLISFQVALHVQHGQVYWDALF